MMVGIMFLLLGIATSCSDGDEAILPEQASAKMPATEVVVNKDSCMQLFSQILSKAVSQRQDVRMFLKAQALKKFDNDFNVFYPFVKTRKLENVHLKMFFLTMKRMKESWTILKKLFLC